MKPLISRTLLLSYTLLVSLSINAQWWSPVKEGVIVDIRSLKADTVNNLLYAGGDIDSAGSQVVTHVAVWDGVSWAPLDTGFNEHVDILEIYNGELYAGGDFDLAPGNTPVGYIAKWNGTSWSDPGGGLNNFVFALTVFNGDLYAGGEFTQTSTGNMAAGIARWNGTTWSALGSGIDGTVYTLKVYNGELYAGGQFTMAGGTAASNIARWNGSAWSAVGSGMDGKVTSLEVYNGMLIAGGAFMNAGGTSSPRIAAWDGSNWQSLGAGLVGSPSFVDALEVYNGKLFAGGHFTYSTSNLYNIAWWDGSNWNDVSGGVTGNYPVVLTLEEYRGELYAGGSFEQAGAVVLNNIARWNELPPVADFSTTDTVICTNTCIDFFDYSHSSPASWNWTFTGAQTVTSSVQHPAGICYDQPGTFQVKLTVQNILGTDSLTKTGYITVLASPVATITPDDTAICEGEFIKLSTGQYPGATYEWFHQSAPVAGAHSDTLSVSNPGDYHVVITNSAGCTDTSVVTTITVNPVPVQPVISQSFDTLMATPGTASLQWLFNGSPISGATDSMLQATQNGSYTVTVTNQFGCSATSTPYHYNSTGINEFAGHQIMVYPNPSSGNFIIANHGEERPFQVSDLTGRVVYTGNLKAGKHPVDLTWMPAGSYLLSLYGSSETIRIILTR